MPVSEMLFGVPAVVSWSIGPLVIRGDDLFAVIGLLVGLALLTLWVVVENFRLTRWRPGQHPASRASAPGSNGSSGIAPGGQAGARDSSPVRARAEWLLDDNTLVRMGAVRRESLRRAARQARADTLVPTADPTAAPELKPVMKASRPLRIAIMGTRGIPAAYNSFEMRLEQLAVRLVERGHEVTVYCHSRDGVLPEKTYQGVRLVTLPAIASGRFKMISHTLLSMLHAQFQRYDVIYLGSVENGPLAGIPRLTGRPTVTYAGNTAAAAADSWDGFSQRYRRFSERMTAKLASCVVSDSRTVQQYYRGRFKAPAVFVPFGADVPHMAAGETLRRLGLRPDGYLLWVGQLTPGNNAHDVIEAYQQLGGPATGLSLCLAGEAPKGSDYAAELKRTAGPGVIFTGRLSSDSYYELGSNACLFVFSGESDRARPALLEALAFGACVIVNDAPANMEAVGDAALPYVGAGGAGDLARAVAQTLANPALIGEYRQRAARRATTIYSWNAVTDQYESLFAQLAHAMPRVPTGPFGASGA